MKGYRIFIWAVTVSLVGFCVAAIDDKVMETSSARDPGDRTVGDSPSVEQSPCSGDSIPAMRDCSEIQDKCPGHSSGYSNSFTVYCDFDKDGGGWTVFQRREDGSVDFERGWESYKHGFGFLLSEFWLGNDKLAYLTYQKDYELRIELHNKQGTAYYAKYTLFRIGGERELYQITLGAYSGNAGSDALDYHRNRAFTTLDADHDTMTDGNCAHIHNGAWWFGNCDNSNLNALYGVDSNYSPGGIEWDHLPGGSNQGLTFTEMKIRPKI